MKHLRFSFLIWRMEPRLKYCSDLINKRTEHPGHKAKMSEYLRPFKGRRFPGRTPPGRAGLGAVFHGTRGVGPAHAPSLSAGLTAVALSVCHRSPLLLPGRRSSLFLHLTSREWRCPLLFILSQNHTSLDFKLSVAA